MKWIKKNLSSVILCLVFLVGLSLLLYPTISDYWNSIYQSKAITSYESTVAKMREVDYRSVWDAAIEYNRKLQDDHSWFLTEEEEQEYNSLLNVGGTGMMGYLEIPDIDFSLPIYHGVDEAVLQVAIGHLVGSSLPVGGESTHCVISGHRGLPSAKLFTNLDQLKEGDIFMMRVLDETLTYEVDQIRIVEPEDLSNIGIVEGEDLCTLVTCTPYGVNSHRLLVRGHRIENIDASSIRVTADALQIDPVIVAPVVAAPILLLLLIVLLVRYRKR